MLKHLRLCMIGLLWAVVSQANAQVLDTLKATSLHIKKQFVVSEKIIIPPAILNNPRYKDVIDNINTNYNDHIDKGYYPIGLDGAKIKFDINNLALNCKQVTKRNPFGTKSYPISYSVIYKGCLVTLFEPGKLMCTKLSDFERDTIFEKTLNVMPFQYHWLIGNQLLAISNGVCYEFNKDKWVKYTQPFPLTNSPAVYDDEKYLCYSSCMGEFGGYVYFYNKLTKETHYTEATCAVTIYKENSKYYVLSSLGHGFGSAGLTEIANPDSLPLKPASGYAKPSEKGKTNVFSYQGIQLFSTFRLNSQVYYLAYWLEMPFLARIENNVFFIADPLLHQKIYMHNAITTNYGGVTLITYSFYGQSREREVAAIVISKGNFTRVNW